MIIMNYKHTLFDSQLHYETQLHFYTPRTSENKIDRVFSPKVQL